MRPLHLLIVLLVSSPAAAVELLVSGGLDVAAYTASSSDGSDTPDRAFDGDIFTRWRATGNTGWIEVDLGRDEELRRVTLQVSGSPGNATYEVWVSSSPIQGDTTGAVLAHSFSQLAEDRDILQHVFPPGTPYRYVQFRTTVSSAQAAWRELQVYARRCVDADQDGFFDENGCGTALDCNDSSAAQHPSASESCDAADNNCDGLTDNAPECLRVCPQPESTGPEQVVFGGAGYSRVPDLVWTGTRYGVAWADQRDGTDVLFGLLGSGGREIGTPTTVSDSPGGATDPALVWTGNGFGVAWYDSRFQNEGTYFALLDADGNKLTGDIFAGPLFFPTVGPAVAWSGNSFGVLWFAGNRLDFRKLQPDGTLATYVVPVIDTPGTRSGTPCLEWTGDSYAILYRQEVASNDWSLFFTRIDADGVQLMTPVQLSATIDQDASCVWADDGLALVWERDSDDLYFSKVAADGTVQIPEVRFVNATPDAVRDPALAWTGGEYGVTWSEERPGQGRYNVYFNRIDATGQSLPDERRLDSDPEDSLSPSIAWTGREYGLVWSDYRTDTGDNNQELFFVGVRCECPDPDGDGDGVEACYDCDDDNAAVYPGAPQVCDGLNNDCDAPGWPALSGTNDGDDDVDGVSECAGDCDPGNGAVYPGAPQICDGINNDCASPLWPDPAGTNEADDDGDGYSECAGDCDDDSTARGPDVPESCNGVDDDCNDLVDDDALGEDSDGDGVLNVCDNCRQDFNPTQLDSDHDTVGNSCDNCIATPNPDQADLDSDSRGDLCDNCPADANVLQDDSDGDTVGDACDNCLFDRNRTQSDQDGDSQGDHCDLDDGLIYILNESGPAWVEWQDEGGFDAWNAYRGDLSVLRATGEFTQAPGSNPLARQDCGLIDPWVAETGPDPLAGEVAFYLTTGIEAGVESGLGQRSNGEERPNGNACP